MTTLLTLLSYLGAYWLLLLLALLIAVPFAVLGYLLDGEPSPLDRRRGPPFIP